MFSVTNCSPQICRYVLYYAWQAAPPVVHSTDPVKESKTLIVTHHTRCVHRRNRYGSTGLDCCVAHKIKLTETIEIN